MFMIAVAPSPTQTPAPIRRCLILLDGLATQGVRFARRLHAALTRPTNLPRETPRRQRANHLLHRALIAIRYAATLSDRLAADPLYRGEPARPARATTPATSRYRWSPAPPQSPRVFRTRRFEHVFAGRSVGQIVDYIRHDLGLPGRIGPRLDQQLGQPDPIGRPHVAPIRTPLPEAPALLRSIAQERLPTLALTLIAPGTGPP